MCNAFCSLLLSLEPFDVFPSTDMTSLAGSFSDDAIHSVKRAENSLGSIKAIPRLIVDKEGIPFANAMYFLNQA
ncbi:Uncharacterised protein [Mycobacterium tuberculosis]|nr:Uncharacterised protein [Mycobacterium tuberculosis]